MLNPHWRQYIFAAFNIFFPMYAFVANISNFVSFRKNSNEGNRNPVRVCFQFHWRRRRHDCREVLFKRSIRNTQEVCCTLFCHNTVWTRRSKTAAKECHLVKLDCLEWTSGGSRNRVGTAKKQRSHMNYRNRALYSKTGTPDAPSISSFMSGTFTAEKHYSTRTPKKG